MFIIIFMQALPFSLCSLPVFHVIPPLSPAKVYRSLSKTSPTPFFPIGEARIWPFYSLQGPSLLLTAANRFHKVYFQQESRSQELEQSPELLGAGRAKAESLFSLYIK